MGKPNDMSGIIGKNNYKSESKHPDYTGTVTIRGEALRIAAWQRTNAKNDEKFLSLKFSEPIAKKKVEVNEVEEAKVIEEQDFPF